MPQYRNPFEKGDLYIKFDVQFPENNWISPEKLSVSSFTGMDAVVLFDCVCKACVGYLTCLLSVLKFRCKYNSFTIVYGQHIT